jgi:hypothetical protein
MPIGLNAARRTGLAFAVSLAAVLPDGASAQDTQVWAENIENWLIGVDPSIGNGCYMLSDFVDESFLRIQFNPDLGNLQFIIGNPKWRSIQGGQLYKMTVQFGNAPVWEGDGEGFWWGDDSPSLILGVGYEQNAAQEFIDELMRMNSVAIGYQGREIANLSLNGTTSAMSEVMNCQDAMNQGGQAPGGGTVDPFSNPPQPGPQPPGGGGGNDDPFN